MPDLVPVDHDPFASSQNSALAASMTHMPEQPNPAQPYLDAATRFAGGGLQRAFGLPNNFVGETLQNPDNQAAMGMAISGENLTTLRKLISEGMTQRQAASELGTSLGDVQRTIRKEGLPTNPTRGAPIKQIGEFTSPELTIDKAVKSLFRAPSADYDPLLDKLRSAYRLEPVDHDPFKE